MELEYCIMSNIIRISHNGRRKMHNQPEQAGCRHRGYGHILDLLSKHNGLTQQQIAQMLGIRPQSASEAVSNLEEQGMVKKSPHPLDKRSYLLHITPEGLKRQGEIRERRQENACRIFAPLSEEEKDTLQALLCKVVAALEENKEDL